MLNDERRLASVACIHDIHPIPGADAIECGMIRNWPIVIGKGEFHDGEQVLYIEPDAALPLSDPRFTSLGPRGTKTIDGADYHVLRTIRLRGQLSQGIVFGLDKFPELSCVSDSSRTDGLDLDKALGIKLWEPPQPPLGAEQMGPWNLRWLKKTDAERVQNLSDQWLQSVDDGLWIPTEKIDGTSITYALDEACDLHVYSRNWQLKTDNPQATPMELAERYGVRDQMIARGVDALQGEMFGAGIQSNRLGVSGHRLAVFAMWDSASGQANDRFVDLYNDPGNLEVAPMVDVTFPHTVEEALAQADGCKSLINPERLAEGIVWHHNGNAAFPELDYRLQFKAVSAAYLIKHGL